VPYYDFEVLHGDEVIVAETSVALDSSKAAWPIIIDIAKMLNRPGCRIRVREHLGETIILIGAVAARRYPNLAFSA
jgi:hypothetical protein